VKFPRATYQERDREENGNKNPISSYVYSPTSLGLKSLSDDSRKYEHFTLTFEDNGKGFPEYIDFRNSTSLGLQLVNALVDQIEGSIELERGRGTKFVIKFTV
jgi:two-component sensor histidine kinase